MIEYRIKPTNFFYPGITAIVSTTTEELEQAKAKYGSDMWMYILNKAQKEKRVRYEYTQ